MIMHCIHCGKEIEMEIPPWEIPFIERAPLLCDACSRKAQQAFGKMAAKCRSRHRGKSITIFNPNYKEEQRQDA
jgi:hypothetical protein